MLQMKNLAEEIHQLSLPSSLWGAHVDPEGAFIAILHVNLICNKIDIDKGVLLTWENGTVRASMSLNGEIVNIPHITSKIETIGDLATLITSLHGIKFCANATVGVSKCLKYIINNDQLEFCDQCTIDAINNDDGLLEECRNFLDPLAFSTSLDSSQPKAKTELCTTCGKRFLSNFDLKQHILTHTGSKPFKCKICMKSFAKKYNLNVHIRVHSGERPYCCSKCGKTFNTRSNLSTHMNSTHSEEKRHRCEFCAMSFVHPRVLRIHMRKHTGEKPFMCKICGRTFAKKIHLTIHTRTHTGEKPFICAVCGKGFTTSGNLNAHNRTNHTN